MAPGQVFFGQPGKYHPVQFDDFIAQVLEETPYNAVAATVQLDPNFLFRGIVDIAYLICLYQAVFKFNP